MYIYPKSEKMEIHRRRTEAGIEINHRRQYRESRWARNDDEQIKRISLGGGSRKKGAYSVWISEKTNTRDFEMDEVYWFVKMRKGFDKGINTFIMTVVSREPHQILAFNVDKSVNAKAIQKNIDSCPKAKYYWVDGCPKYKGVDYYGGILKQNFEDKSDTYTVEGTNSDLRHYIAGLRRKSKCFFRSVKTLRAILWVFVNAYNKFGDWKMDYFSKHPNADRDIGFNHTRFI